MMARLSTRKQDSLSLFSPHSLPQTLIEVLENIDSYQSRLDTLFSSALNLFEETFSTNSLKMFLMESQERLRCFMLTFEELAMQVWLIKPQTLSSSNINIFEINTIQRSQTIVELVWTTTALCEILTFLNSTIDPAESHIFLRDYLQRSLIFYKQTTVVLNGYLREYKV